MSRKFQVGDIITCAEEGHYSLTVPGVLCEVIDMRESPMVLVNIKGDDEAYKVNENHFRIVEKVKISSWRDTICS